MAETWLSIVEYARTYKISDMTVRRRIKTGKLEAVLQDGKYFIPIRPETALKNPVVGGMSPLKMDTTEASSNQIKVGVLPQGTSSIQIIKAHPTGHRGYPNSPATPSVHPRIPDRTTNSHSLGQDNFVQSYKQPENKFGSTPTRPHSASSALQDFGEKSRISDDLRQSILKSDTSLIDTRALLSFCENALRKVQDGERKMIERFKSKLEALETTLSARDQEIKSLKQQLEDLQLLVKILEKRK